MRFHTKFTRNKGGAGKQLGTDTSPPTAKPGPNADNVLSAQVKSSWGSSIKRIAVAYIPPSGSLALDATLFVYEGLTETWHKLAGGGVGVIKPGELVFFDMPAISDKMVVPGGDTANHAAGFDVQLIVTDPGAAPAGDHVFALAAIVSQKGI